ncbi:MAG: sigma 54-interacting transcriptional regulator [Desulfocurvus sp.]|jgi:transcriptional regulator with PAS, ATPase and Fis domain|nr:sigma 54-interacting transcriptional regulator [Desulfocurvus sp.]
MKIKHLMHRGDSFVRPQDTIAEAIQHYLGDECNCVPVVDDRNKPLGVLTIYRVIAALRDGVSVHAPVDGVYARDIQSVNQEVGFDAVRDLPLERLLVLDDTGKLVGVLSKIELISRIFEAFDLTAQELKILLMTVPLGIIALDDNGVITEINNAAEAILGIEANAAYGMDVGVLFRGALESGDVLHGMGPQTMTVRGVRCVAQARAILRDGVPHGTVMVLQDISELDALSRELDSVNTLLAELDVIVGTLPDPLWVLDEGGGEVYVNERAREQFPGLERLRSGQGCVGELERRLSDLVRGVLDGTLAESFSRVLTEDDGREVIVKYSPVRDVRQRAVRHVFHLQDVTEMNRLRRESARHREELQALRGERSEKDGIVYRSRSMAEVMAQVRKVALVESTVLVLGDSGVGKGEVARRIHSYGPRADRPFMALNCGAIPESLLESELFGYERGAFTGAERGGKVGLLEVANHGCLFLDEIGEMPLALQVKLLRFLQESEIMRVGGSRPIKLDVRIISATNKNLHELVERGQFRKDLFYRLNVVPIHIPPLRERVEDILPLAHHFLKRVNAKYGRAKRLCPETCNLLERYAWPGNVRELINVIERITIMSDDDVLAPSTLPAYFNYPGGQEEVCRTQSDCLRTALENVEQSMIRCALKKHGGIRPASRALGISHPTLLRKMHRYGIAVQE